MTSAPTPGATPEERLKRNAARAAVALVESGMTLGLGSGSTAAWATRAIAERIASGDLERVVGVPTSEATARQARDLGVELVELGPGGVDLAIDGMDEVDPHLGAIKGLGGALFREKIVAASARRFVLIGDVSKRVDALGAKAPLPVEVAEFGWRHTAARLEELGLAPRPRRDAADEVARSDNGNRLLDCPLEPPLEPDAALELGRRLDAVPGVVGHGLFLGLAERAFVASDSGVLELTRSDSGAPEGGRT